MTKRLFNRGILSHIKNRNSIYIRSAICNVDYCGLHTQQQVPVKEIQIPVKWGHIAGKLWGTDQSRPILALHGWQDNAGTWDPLIPMLIKDRSVLAIDFPGHGLSSWIPPGVQYYHWELPRLILYLKEYFKWDKVSLLCHSMGAIAGFRFASLFPDDVDFYIGVDILISDDYDLTYVINRIPMLLKKGLMAQHRLDEEPPSYTLEEMAKLWHLGTIKSVALESVKYLLKRGARQSKHDPNKYHFSRDSRLKYSLFNPESKDFVENVVRRVKCPVLYVKAVDSPFGNDAFALDMCSLLETNNENFEWHSVPGTHHVHLNNPEVVAPLIKRFLQKHIIAI